MSTRHSRPYAIYVLQLTEDELSNLMLCVDTTVKAAGNIFVRQAAAIVAECDRAFASVEQVRAAYEAAHGDITEEKIEAVKEKLIAVGKLH